MQSLKEELRRKQVVLYNVNNVIADGEMALTEKKSSCTNWDDARLLSLRSPIDELTDWNKKATSLEAQIDAHNTQAPESSLLDKEHTCTLLKGSIAATREYQFHLNDSIQQLVSEKQVKITKHDGTSQAQSSEMQNVQQQINFCKSQEDLQREHTEDIYTAHAHIIRELACKHGRQVPEF
jgi:hypothetical protein